MADDLHAFPPPTVHDNAHASDSPPANASAADTSPASEQAPRLSHPIALFAAAAGLGIAAGAIVGTAIFAFVLSVGSADCSSSDGWCELGAAILALFAALLVGGIAYIVAGVTTIVRCRPKGLRAPHIGAHVILPAAVVIAMFLLGLAVDVLS